MRVFDLSVIIPAYRAEAFIARAIQSVLDQPGVNPEIIVVVDGVYDRTSEIAGQYRNTTVLINQTNQGAPAARNRGARAATCDYVIFLDADDFYNGAYLLGLLDAIVAANADMAIGPIQGYSEQHRGFLGVRHLPSAGSSKADLIRSALGGFPGQRVCWRLDFLMKIGLWNECMRAFQDAELILRALPAALRVAFSAEGCVVYVEHDSEFRIGSQPGRIRLEENIKLLTKTTEVLREYPIIFEDIYLDLALRYYANARVAYRIGQYVLGDDCMSLACEYGGLHLIKIRVYRTMIALLGCTRAESFAARLGELTNSALRLNSYLLERRHQQCKDGTNF